LSGNLTHDLSIASFAPWSSVYKVQKQKESRKKSKKAKKAESWNKFVTVKISKQ